MPRPNFEDVLTYLAASGEYVKTEPSFQAYVGKRGAPLTLGTYERSRPNGTVIEVRTVPAPGGAVIRTYADITARRQAEEALRQSEARYRILAETTNDVIIQLDLNMMRQYVSPVSLRMFGYTPAEMLHVDGSVMVHPNDLPHARAMATLLVTGDIEGDRTIVTYRMQHKSGRWIWVETAMNLVRDAKSAAPTSVICSLRDVTERQLAAQQLESAKSAAEQAARAKSEFLANMSHELRTPLTGMLWVHDLLRRDPKLNDAQRRLVGLASEAGRSLLTIVNDILDFSKIEAGQLAIETVPFDLHELLVNCRDLAAENIRQKQIGIATNFTPSSAGWFVGDPMRVRQVLLNLLTNAVKFTERGQVDIDVKYCAETAKLRVEVADTGIGVPPQKVGLLFERFTQADTSTSRRYGGTGLGLSICKRLLDLMNGRIGFDARAQGGSTFWFELPLVRHDGKAAEERVVDVGAKPKSSRRILLAEDNAINSEIVATMLSERGYDVIVVCDGRTAVLAAQDDPDMILMDLQMPTMDGLAAAAAIRREERARGRPRTPIIGLTANAMSEDVEECLAAGMDAHVAKPIDWMTLFAIMDRFFSTSRTSELDAPALEERTKVLDKAMLDSLSDLLGHARVVDTLARFLTDLQIRMTLLDEVSPIDVANQAHSLASISGQLGFAQFSNLCGLTEMKIRQGHGGDYVAPLREAAQRALAAAQSCDYSHVA